MKPRKKGKQWEISYRCPGHSKPIYERFSSLELANIRIAEIEYDRSRGQLRPPVVTPLSKDTVRPKKSLVTVAELMDEYVQLYGLNHWSESTLSDSQHRIDDYIEPYLGSVYIQDLTTHSLDVFYDSLLDKPAIALKGHKAKKQISPSVIAKIHALLRSALNQAVAWGYIPSNPAMNCSPPKYDAEERAVWTQEEAKQAISICDDPMLKLAMQLAVGASGRIGEILGLTWDCVDISPESMEAQCPSLYINKIIYGSSGF